VRRTVLAHTTRGEGSPGGTLPLTSRAVDALRGAVEEASRLGDDYVGTEHLLLALFRDPDALAAKALAALGAGYEDVRARIIETLAGSSKR